MSKKPPQLGELAAQSIEGFFFFSKHIIPFKLNKARHYNESGSDEQENSYRKQLLILYGNKCPVRN